MNLTIFEKSDLNMALKLTENNRRIIVFVSFILLLSVGISIYKDYGYGWDERASRHIGMVNFNYITTNDQELLTFQDQYYGPVFEVLLIYFEKALNLNNTRDIYFMRHLVAFLLFYLGVIFFYLLCKDQFNSWKIGLLGSLLLILSPKIFAESFYNSKDIGLLSMYIICSYTLIKYLEKKTLLRAFLHGFTSAICVDIRILGILLPFITFLFVAIDLIWMHKSIKMKNTIYSLALYGFSLCFFTILFWPILWEGPIYHFIQAYKQMSRFKVFDLGNLYFGKYVDATDLPWHYIPVWIIITTPLLYVFNFFIGLYAFLKNIFENFPNLYNNQRRNDLIFILWFFLPLLAVIYHKSVLWDSWRHVFFIYPAFLMISLKGLIFLFDFIRVKSKGRVYRIVNIIVIIIIALSLINVAQFMIKNHPYQNIYFSILGLVDMKFIKNNFELDYWGLSYRAALEYILKNDMEKTIKINVANPPGVITSAILTPEERHRLEYVKKPEEAKYFLSEYRWHKEDYPYENEFYSIKINGTKIMVVYLMAGK